MYSVGGALMVLTSKSDVNSIRSISPCESHNRSHQRSLINIAMDRFCITGVRRKNRLIKS